MQFFTYIQISKCVVTQKYLIRYVKFLYLAYKYTHHIHLYESLHIFTGIKESTIVYTYNFKL